MRIIIIIIIKKNNPECCIFGIFPATAGTAIGQVAAQPLPTYVPITDNCPYYFAFHTFVLGIAYVSVTTT